MSNVRWLVYVTAHVVTVVVWEGLFGWHVLLVHSQIRILLVIRAVSLVTTSLLITFTTIVAVIDVILTAS